jgi:hypothetical protein
MGFIIEAAIDLFGLPKGGGGDTGSQTGLGAA